MLDSKLDRNSLDPSHDGAGDTDSPTPATGTPGVVPFEGRAARPAGTAVAAGPTAETRRYRLALRFAAFNLAGFALLGAAWGRGWVDHVAAADVTAISVGIFVVFLGGLALCAWAVWRISGELNAVRADEPSHGTWTREYLAAVAGRDPASRALLADALRIRLAGRIALIRHVANILVLLGLIGTVLGFVIALSGVDPDIAGDVSKVTPMVARLIEGMSVALYTTLVGAILHLWLGTAYQMLAGGVSTFAATLIARGEGHA